MNKQFPYTGIIPFLIFFLFALSACQAPKQKSTGWTSGKGEIRPGPATGKAVIALLGKARQASKKGELEAAESHLERALRIEPHNPTLWLYMAKLRLFAAKSAEAINLAKKALALSNRSGNTSKSEQRSLQSDCWRVIAHAHQKMANTEQARQAMDKAKVLSD